MSTSGTSAAREAARHGDGRFGTQTRAEADLTTIELGAPASPEPTWVNVGYDHTVPMRTLDRAEAESLLPPGGRFRQCFTIDGSVGTGQPVTIESHAPHYLNVRYEHSVGGPYLEGKHFAVDEATGSVHIVDDASGESHIFYEPVQEA